MLGARRWDAAELAKQGDIYIRTSLYGAIIPSIAELEYSLTNDSSSRVEMLNSLNVLMPEKAVGGNETKEAAPRRWPNWKDVITDTEVGTKRKEKKIKVTLSNEDLRAKMSTTARCFVRIHADKNKMFLTEVFESAPNKGGTSAQRAQRELGVNAVDLSEVFSIRNFTQRVTNISFADPSEKEQLQPGCYELVRDQEDYKYEAIHLHSFDAFCFFLVFWGFLPEVAFTKEPETKDKRQEIRQKVSTDIWARRPWGDDNPAKYNDVKEFFRSICFGDGKMSHSSGSPIFLCERQMYKLCQAAAWQQTELVPKWFASRWLQVSGVGYMSTTTGNKATSMTEALRKFADDSLWRAAAAGMLRSVPFCGFEGKRLEQAEKDAGEDGFVLPPWSKMAVGKSTKLRDVLNCDDEVVRDCISEHFKKMTDARRMTEQYKSIAKIQANDLHRVLWPYWLCMVWEEVGHTSSPGKIPTLLNTDQLYNFFMKLLYVDAYNFPQKVQTDKGWTIDMFKNLGTKGDIKRLDLPADADSSDKQPRKLKFDGAQMVRPHEVLDMKFEMMDLTWYKAQASQCFAFRGITLEMWETLSLRLDTVASSDKYFFQCLAAQNESMLDQLGMKQGEGEAMTITYPPPDLAQQYTALGLVRYGMDRAIQLKSLRDWLTADVKHTRITVQSFRTFVAEARLGIPDGQVGKIFDGIIGAHATTGGSAGAADSEDSSGGGTTEQTISYAECNNALRAYNSTGLWKDGVISLIKMAFPTGPLKDMALHNVDAAWDKFDPDGSGTIEPTEVRSLIMTLMTPGVKTDVFENFVANPTFLGFSIPRATIHELTDLVDANHDGFLQADEFISLLMGVVRSDVPGRVLARLNVSYWQIGKVVLSSLMYLIFLFMMIALVIQSFTSGHGLAQVVQTVCSGASVFYVKSQENTAMAKEEARLIAWAKEKVTEELAQVLNITSQAVQDMKNKQGGEQKKGDEGSG